MKDPQQYIEEAKQEVAKKYGYESHQIMVSHYIHIPSLLIQSSERVSLLALQNQASDLKKELREKIEQTADGAIGIRKLAIQECLEIINNS